MKGVRLDAESTVHFTAFLKHWRFDRAGTLAGETPPREFKLKSATDYLIEKLTNDGLQDTSTDVKKSEKTQ